jgi:ParB family transcriptional regulator, chromosome partitioning protein
MSTIAVLQASESNEWYTPETYAKAVQQVLRGVELDPASCALANQMIQAERIYTSAENGLMHSWRCRSLFCNPPYGKASTGKSNQETWSCKWIDECEAGNVEEAILLVNAVLGNSWFQRLWYNYHVCLTNHRIRFWSPQTSDVHPTFSNAFFYFGKHSERFREHFQQFGRVIEPDYSALTSRNLELWSV